MAAMDWTESTVGYANLVSYHIGLYLILIWPDIRPITLPDTGYLAGRIIGYPAKL